MSHIRNLYPLPPLPYPDDALEPVLDARTVNIHHTGHEASYYTGLEEALDSLERGRSGGKIDDRVRRRMRLSLANSISFNGAGAILHHLYWENLAKPGAGGNPSKALHEQIEHDFGNAKQFVEEFSDVAIGLQGSGWAVLVWSPEFERLFVLAIENHQNGWIPGCVPLLIVDVWEHAYYLKYQNKRNNYVRDLWQAINWQTVSRRFAAARRSE
jgi:Fe-Mn family superoxide dismutase